jgi:lipid A 3-O-deacylase
MRRFLPLALLNIWFYTASNPGHAQSVPALAQRDSVTHMLLISEDDDFINIWGNGTDNAYTNGTGIYYFYKPSQPSRFFLDKWMPAAGDSSTNIYGWGLTQLMYTPDDINSSAYQPNDYPWSGGLYASHTRYSYDAQRHYDFQTELVLGVMGPAALDREFQSLAHHMINYLQPTGWGRQYSNDLLLNVNFTVEKQLASIGNTVTIIGGGQVYAGTMQNGAAIYPMILVGKMDNYFNGFFSQYSSPGCDKRHKRWQIYGFIKPELQYFATYALLQGGPFTKNPNLQQPPPDGKTPNTTSDASSTTSDASSTSSNQGNADNGAGKPQPYHPLQHILTTLDYGAVLTHGRFGISFSQNVSEAMLKGLYCHDFGNISLFYGW